MTVYLAWANLPLSFWEDAVRTASYVRFRLPCSALPLYKTPYEMVHGVQATYFLLRAWGCRCWVIIPPELLQKGSPRRYEAIFVGYEEGRVGWRVRDLRGRYRFSRDVIFDENTPGYLGRVPDDYYAPSDSAQKLPPPSNIPQFSETDVEIQSPDPEWHLPGRTKPTRETDST
ncbi:hypothetical protein MPER_02755 [Moniliophthora perniciosa FA553]|nr:hypothetical protein MPER_02755 [Moniliophthora perniciosa FA553]